MSLVYIIPGPKKQVNQGPTVQDTIPTPKRVEIGSHLQSYDLQANSVRYRGFHPEQLDGPVNLDLFIPKRAQTIQNLTYPSQAVTRYIDVPAAVVVQDIFKQKQSTITTPQYGGSKTSFIDVGPIIQDQQVFKQRKLPEPYYLITYPIPRHSKQIETVTVTPTHEGFVIRKAPTFPIPQYPSVRMQNIDVVAATPSIDIFKRYQQPYPFVSYQSKGWNPKQHINITPYVPEQTYIFPLQKPIQEYYSRLEYKRFRNYRAPQLDTPVIIQSGNALLACVDTAITWENHFINNGWTTPQAQITAGYTIYVEPSLTTGSYQEVFDFGSIISNIIAVVNWNQASVVGTVATASTTLETSTDGITWSAPTLGTSVFAQSLRYVRLTMNFVGANDKSLSIYTNLQCLLNVHREQDGGQANVFAADAGGTTVTFNKAFKALDALAVTPLSTLEQKAVYDFAFPPNPTTFKVFLFNAAGARIDGLVTWVARGIF